MRKVLRSELKPKQELSDAALLGQARYRAEQHQAKLRREALKEQVLKATPDYR